MSYNQIKVTIISVTVNNIPDAMREKADTTLKGYTQNRIGGYSSPCQCLENANDALIDKQIKELLKGVCENDMFFKELAEGGADICLYITNHGGDNMLSLSNEVIKLLAEYSIGIGID